MAMNRNTRRVPTHLQVIGDRVAQYVKRDNPEVKIDGLKPTSFEDYTDEYDKTQLLEFYRMRLTPAQFEHLKTKGFVKFDAHAYYFDQGKAYVTRTQNENKAPEWPSYLFSVDYDKNGNFKGHSLLGARAGIKVGGYSAEEAYSQKPNPVHEATRKAAKESAGKKYSATEQYETPPFQINTISTSISEIDMRAIDSLIYARSKGVEAGYNILTGEVFLAPENQETSTGN